MKKLLDNPNKAAIAVVIFLVLFFSLRSCDAEAASVELGPSLLNGYGLVYAEDLGEDWSAGMMLISEQEVYNQTIGNNGGFFITRMVRKNDFSMGLGIARWVSTSRVIGAELGFHLSLHYNLLGRYSINYRHWSNAGTADQNRGQDLLTIGWRFK